MIDKDKIDSVFSVALPEMNPKNRDSWTHRYGIYKHPKTVFTGPFASMMEGRQNQLLNYIERVAELALTESNGHPDKSSWKTELEESIPALEKAVQHNEEQTKGRFPTGHESNSLRDARQALSDAQFLLAYASGLVKQENNTPFVTSPETALWVQIATHLVDKHILKNKNGYGYSPNGQHFKKAEHFNGTVKKYCKENNITLNLNNGKQTPLAKFIELGLLYPPIAKDAYKNSEDFQHRYLSNKSRNPKKS